MSEPRSKSKTQTLKMGCLSGTTSSPISCKPCFCASVKPKRVKFSTTGHHLSGPTIESGTSWGKLRTGIHSATAPLGREHHKDTATALLGRLHCKDIPTLPLGRAHYKGTATAPIVREQHNSGFTLKFQVSRGSRKFAIWTLEGPVHTLIYAIKITKYTSNREACRRE